MNQPIKTVPCCWCDKPVELYADELPGLLGVFCSLECRLERAREINLR